jgi:signal transduction histidine kinase
VVQEALTNVLRHAGPTTASVEITHDPGTVAVAVRDRGRGLAGPAAPVDGRHGLGSLRARAESLGGTLTVTGRPDGGVEVAARLPRRARP